MADQRTNGWSNRTIRFINDGRTFSGWRETGGGGTSVESSKYPAAGAKGDTAVTARIKTTDDITLMGAFPVDQEVAIRKYFRRQVGQAVEFFDDVLNPDTGAGAGSEVYRGRLSKMTPPSGGDGTSTDVAEIELTLVVNGTVG
jgi:hypothetical protein